MDKTYAETRDEEPFDWHLALAKPPKRRSDGHAKLHEMAKDWVTCACGNQCAIIPRTVCGKPLDRDLMWLGVFFGSAVEDAHWAEARALLPRIEARAGELIEIELRKLNGKAVAS